MQALIEHRANIIKCLVDSGFDSAKFFSDSNANNHLIVVVNEPANRNRKASEFRMDYLKYKLEKFLFFLIEVQNSNQVDRGLLDTLQLEQEFQTGLDVLRAYFRRNSHPFLQYANLVSEDKKEVSQFSNIYHR